MNVKLNESEYQHLIIELLAQSIEKIGLIRQNAGEDETDWIHLIERLKAKGILNELRDSRSSIKDKPRHAARMMILQFNKKTEKTITTIM